MNKKDEIEIPYIQGNNIGTAEGFWSEICVNGRPSKKLFMKLFEDACEKYKVDQEKSIENLFFEATKKLGW